MSAAQTDLFVFGVTPAGADPVTVRAQLSGMTVELSVHQEESTALAALQRKLSEVDPFVLIGIVDMPPAGPEVDRRLGQVVDMVRSGDRGIWWAQAPATNPSSVLRGLLMEAAPRAVTTAQHWTAALAESPDRGGLSEALFEQIEDISVLPGFDAPSDGAFAQADMVRDAQEPGRLLSIIRRAARRRAAGMPGWEAAHSMAIEAALTLALRLPSLDREELAEGLVAIADRGPLASEAALSNRARAIVVAARQADRQTLSELLQLRVLVVGHDLKFIDFLYEYLPDSVVVREDRWTGEKKHDVKLSRELVAWADVVWVEWLAYSAQWYSRMVRNDQVLIVRQHRYELLRDAGEGVDYSRVAAVVAIAVHTLEGVRERFGVDRGKLRLVPNIYEADRYARADELDADRQFKLALVGSVPRLKGLHRAIEVLERLRREDARYTLTIFGKSPEELPWVLANPDEGWYYRACANYIEERGLDSAITYAGWSDLRQELRNFGYVLSTSDLEGSHVSPGEAFLAGNIGVYLRWRGSNFIYPEEFGFGSPAQMSSFIGRAPLFDDAVMRSVARTRELLAQEQGVAAFLSNVHALVLEQPL